MANIVFDSWSFCIGLCVGVWIGGIAVFLLTILLFVLGGSKDEDQTQKYANALHMYTDMEVKQLAKHMYREIAYKRFDMSSISDYTAYVAAKCREYIEAKVDKGEKGDKK